ncbi:HlyD family efflux transporter periplasmic adaptor subunit [Ktedonosporobacter rubrisoli]|uniref:HlyD family efflux transporter periplasmic adaptor subunit n=1 Tax=Ktedonosporobacter rubrisoli TaxID=2509675 RepID=A0A4P6JZM8_KTERU|nr:HlyD family efflux transporter periplasmic adaptor subunit [Ktedonosporobacter rubrisoli]QBD80576.1 HlyD family efflux transporter periplasmic adaptor subunit [Ktedonosporobacter rubrisoli]
MRRMILVPLLIIVAVLAIAGGVAYYLYNNYLYYSTDDAQVTGSIVSVSATSAGQLSALNVKQGDRVTAGQVIGTVTPPNNGNAVRLTSPIDGTILQVAAVPGQTVAPGVSLVQETNLNSLNITAYVDEGQLDNVKIGQDVDIHIDAFSDTTYTGHVQRVVQATAGSFSLMPTQDNASGNFTKVGQRVPVVISLDGNTGKNIVPGLSAEVTIHIH